MSFAALHKNPLRLYWWKAKPSFGDAINPLIVGNIAGRVVSHISGRRADLFAIGAIMQTAIRAEGRRLCVWGTGLLKPIFGHDFLKDVHAALLHGPIMAALPEREMKQFGDTGLSMNEALPFEGTRLDRIAIMPHYTLVDDPELLAFVASDPAYVLIDPRGDAADVSLQIAACAHVIASSLHGLIIADAHGVATTWIEPKGQNWLKCLDYAGSRGRPEMRALLRINAAKTPRSTSISLADGIAATRYTRAFPPD